MGRWEPDAQGRLEEAALALYLERGYDQTTVAEIAARAGLTERTFFRHFADKREVLFRGGALAEAVAMGIDTAPSGTTPLDVVGVALEALSAFFDENRRPHARDRQAVVAANPALQERELIKMSSLAKTIGEALRRRDVAEPAATLAAETGIAVFKVSFERWLTDAAEAPFDEHVRAVLADLSALTRRP